MNTGEHQWMIANADTPDRIKNHRLLEGVEIERTGIPTRSGVLVTKSLLFVGEGTGGPGASPIFRAVDKSTGEILAEIDLRTISLAFHLLTNTMASNTWRCLSVVAVRQRSWWPTPCPNFYKEHY